LLTTIHGTRCATSESSLSLQTVRKPSKISEIVVCVGLGIPKADWTLTGRLNYIQGATTMNTEVDYGAYEAAMDICPVRTVVVDGSPVMLKTLSLLLELQHGLQLVGTATDGRHAVRRVMELQPDLVLMALRLPGMHGFDATRRIKARSPAPAVIIVTGEDTPECRAAASAAGSDGFVGKQQMVTQLPAAIRRLFPRLADSPNAGFSRATSREAALSRG
jgi:CheY-like chemotaxis protein